MKRLILCLAAGMALLLAPGIAHSQDGKGYVHLKLGVFEPTGDLEDFGFDAGLNAEAALGGYLSPHIALEGATGFIIMGESSGTRDDILYIYPLTGTLKLVAPLGRVKFYGGGGAGIYFALLETEITFGGLEDDDADADVVFGTHLAGGVQFDISDTMTLGIDGKYIWTSEAELDPAPLGISRHVEFDLNGFSVSVVLGIII